MRAYHSNCVRWHIALLLLVCSFAIGRVVADDGADAGAKDRIESSAAELASAIEPWLAAYQLQTEAFTITAEGTLRIDNQTQPLKVHWTRISDDAFDLQIEHSEYGVILVRRDDATVLVLPRHRKIFWGTGETDARDHLSGRDFIRKTIRGTSTLAAPCDLLRLLDAAALAELVTGTQQVEHIEGTRSWTLDGKSKLDFAGSVDSHPSFQLSGDEFQATARLVCDAEPQWPRAAEQTTEEWLETHWLDFDRQRLPRAELERTIARGVARAAEVLAPSSRLTEPTQKDRTVPNGELRWIEGQRVVLLQGSPEAIGQAHAQLLKNEAYRCIDSVLHGFGLVQTIANGRWFREDLERAYEQLKPHIPKRHLAETRALARGLELDESLVESLNVFPELFHCSGFAVFGSATVDGKLYHGRVLDYMTSIGLQDASTTFIVAAEGQIPFVNVGYAGFIGSVSGMNLEKISLGEMGGRGEGEWDGVPMATLMRRALEECDSLESVKRLWTESPRTCEYYYVFADGESRTAVGVAATSQSIEFVAPGQSHPLLGDGIQDTVVLSAGSRLELLRQRIESLHGKIDAAHGTQLMCRPVAMSSNLHNVLFVPEDGDLYIANATHSQPAADRPYVKLSFKELVSEWKERQLQSTLSSTVRRFEAKDTLCLEVEDESSEDAQKCLVGLGWTPEAFTVAIEPSDDEQQKRGIDALVRFPSPVATGDPANDRVAMEWYRAQGVKDLSTRSPAVVVIHESGRGMTVGRLIARGLSKQGVHAFMMQLPTYGLRKPQDDGRKDSQSMIRGMRQGIGDARRAFDAVRVLPGVDPDRISIQGTSLGGFVVATTCGLDQAYHRSIILLAGGDLYSVISRGDRDAAKSRKELEREGYSLEQVKEVLYTIEPLRLAHRVSPTKTWLFSGAYDTVVPPACSYAFAKAAMLPTEQHVEMPADHYSGVVFLPSILKQLANIARQ